MRKVVWIIACFSICALLIGCSGWIVRTSSSKQPRVDQVISGNRGYIFGKALSAPAEPKFTERKVYKIEVEIPSLSIPKKEEQPYTYQPKAQEDKRLWGNQGYIFGGHQKRDIETIKTKTENKSVGIAIKTKVKSKTVPKKLTQSKEKVKAEVKVKETYEGSADSETSQPLSETTTQIKLKKEPQAQTVEETTAEPAKAKIKSHTYKVKKGDTLQKISLEFYGTTKKWTQLFQTNKDALKDADDIYPGQILIIPELKE